MVPGGVASSTALSTAADLGRRKGGDIGGKLKEADLGVADAHGYVVWFPPPTASELLGDTCGSLTRLTAPSPQNYTTYRLISALNLFL